MLCNISGKIRSYIHIYLFVHSVYRNWTPVWIIKYRLKAWVKKKDMYISIQGYENEISRILY